MQVYSKNGRVSTATMNAATDAQTPTRARARTRMRMRMLPPVVGAQARGSCSCWRRCSKRAPKESAPHLHGPAMQQCSNRRGRRADARAGGRQFGLFLPLRRLIVIGQSLPLPAQSQHPLLVSTQSITARQSRDQSVHRSIRGPSCNDRPTNHGGDQWLDGVIEGP